jgi:hypothetical protein
MKSTYKRDNSIITLLQQNLEGTIMIAHIKSKIKTETFLEYVEATAQLVKEIGTFFDIKNTMFLAGLLRNFGEMPQDFDYSTHKAENDQQSIRREEQYYASAGGRYLYERFYSNDHNGNTTVRLMTAAIFSQYGLLEHWDEEEINCYLELPERQEMCYRQALADNAELLEKYEFGEMFEKSQDEIAHLILRFGEIAIKMNGSIADVHFLIGCLQRTIASILINTSMLWDTSIPFDPTSGTKASWHYYKNNIAKKPAKNDVSNGVEWNDKNCDLFDESWILNGFQIAIQHMNGQNSNRIIYVAPSLSVLENHNDVIKSAIEVNEFLEDKIIAITYDNFRAALFEGGMHSIKGFYHLHDAIIIMGELPTLPESEMHKFKLKLHYLTYFCNATVVMGSEKQTRSLARKVEWNIWSMENKDSII